MNFCKGRQFNTRIDTLTSLCTYCVPINDENCQGTTIKATVCPVLNSIVKGKIIQLRELTHTDTSLLTDNNAENNEFWTSHETAF